MKKLFLITGVALVIVLATLAYFRFFYTKSFSPQSDASFESGGLEVQFSYSRPYKKGRLIFGGAAQHALVPYSKVWRTGANEATVFETNQDIVIMGKTLKAGKYSFWTIPNKEAWTIIFNTEYGQWGVDFNGLSNRDPKNDALTVERPVFASKEELEQFTIRIEKNMDEMEISLNWDKTLVAIPFSTQP